MKSYLCYNIIFLKKTKERGTEINKTTKIIIVVVAIILVLLAIAIYAFGGKKADTKTNLNINSVEDLTALVEQIYSGVSLEMPMLQTTQVETDNADIVKSFTGLDNIDKFEYIVASEPMMSSQAYSLVLAKVKNGVDANSIAKAMNENIDARKWVCVSAEKVCSVASGDIICLVMSTEELSTAVFDSFKKIAGEVGKENVRIEAEPELPEIPEDMMPVQE